MGSFYDGFSISWSGVDITRQVTSVTMENEVFEVTAFGDATSTFVTGDTFTITVTCSKALGRYWEHELGA